MRNIQLPEKVNRIITELERHGYEAYAVGGCVRDSILGRTPEDWDITTIATPQEIKQVFKRTVDTGIKHGTVTVLLEKEGFEVTTYRIDGEYEDSRHPKEVLFTRSLKEDLKRRDFTINAMAYNETAGLVDCFGGLADLQHKVIRCVGAAGERFDEDALRILRAVRFSAQLGFSIEEETLRAAGERAKHLERISAERIRTELNKLLLSGYPEKLLVAKEEGITAVILPEFDRMVMTPQNNPNHVYSVGAHALLAVGLVCDEKKQREMLEKAGRKVTLPKKEWTKKEKQALRWAALLHDVAKPDCKQVLADGYDHFYQHAELGAGKAREILRRLKFDNETIDSVQQLIRFHDYRYEPTKRAVRRAVNKIGEERMELLFELQLADVLAQNPALYEKKLAQLEKVRELYDEIIREGECTSLKTLAVNGSDLIAAGCAPGKELGSLLSALLSYVLEEPERNRKELLLEYAKELEKRKEN